MKLITDIKLKLKKMVMDQRSRDFIRHNLKYWPSYAVKDPDAVILMYYCDLPEAMIVYSYFMNLLARKHHAKIMAFSSTRHVFPLDLYYWKRDAVYRSFNTRGFIRTQLDKAQRSEAIEKSQDLIKKIKTEQDVMDLHIHGIWVGIDIYETYLRIYEKPTIDLKDPRLFKMIEEGVGIYIFWRDYLKMNKVKAIVISHDMYIYENILAKIGYQQKIPVYLPNIRGGSYIQEPFSNYNPLLYEYPAMFKRLPSDQQEEGLKLAERQLQRRLSGEVGVDVPGLIRPKRSAFNSDKSAQPVLRKSDKIKVLICSHCFYDNPHGYGRMFFNDFYDWMCFLGEMSKKTDYDWYVKMHPNPRQGTEEIIRGIIAKYPKITFIPPQTSHLQLVEEGLNFVLTVHGSVGHELAALGIQVINAGRNPHIGYGFNWHSKDLEQYEGYLKDLGRLKKVPEKREIYEFYYMHYYYSVADQLYLRSYHQYIAESTQSKDPESFGYEYFLKHLDEAKHREICANLLRFIESGKRHYLNRGPEGD